ncbi:MAG TPA: DMT family transporter [Gemmatimonadales bacterium]|nr:DMT family transporter [Gemmatimonadales bacterium]
MSSNKEGAHQPDHAQSGARSGVWLTDALLALMATIWGVNFAVVKFGTTAIVPVAFTGARMILASAALVILALAMRGRWPSPRDTVALLALGLLGNGVYQWAFVEGIALIKAGSASLILAAVPAITAVLGRIRGTERISGAGASGIALSMAGIGLIVYGGQRTSGDSSTLIGAALVFGAAVCWALYTVLLTPYTRRIDGMKLHAITMWSGTMFVSAVAFPRLMATQWAELSFAGWSAIVYSGLMALVVSYVIWYRGVRLIGPTHTAMFANLQPAIALLVAWPMLGEVPTGWQVVGALLILIGIVLVRRSPKVSLSVAAPQAAN